MKVSQLKDHFGGEFVLNKACGLLVLAIWQTGSGKCFPSIHFIEESADRELLDGCDDLESAKQALLERVEELFAGSYEIEVEDLKALIFDD